jgi:hypothetical protein
MIALKWDCLWFRTPAGHSLPFSPEMIAIEINDKHKTSLDPDFVRQAATAVFHYFKHELGRQTVSVGEFVGALEKVLVGLEGKIGEPEIGHGGPAFIASDLCRLARESDNGELFFFSRLRDELREKLRRSPRLVHFRGLRRCVKQITGAQRWNRHCTRLGDQINSFLRECLHAEGSHEEVALMVDG